MTLGRRCQIPDQRRAVLHAGYQPRAVGRKGERSRTALPGLEPGDHASAFKIKDAQRVGAGKLPVDHQQEPAIAREGKRSALVGAFRRDRAGRFAALHIPEEQLLALARDDGFQVGGDGGAGDPRRRVGDPPFWPFFVGRVLSRFQSGELGVAALARRGVPVESDIT